MCGMMHPNMLLHATILNETLPTYGTRVASVVVMYPHMFPKGLYSSVRLLTDIALVYPFPAMLDCMFLKLIIAEKLHPANTADMIPLLQMLEPNMCCSLTA